MQDDYWVESTRPLNCLVFVAPLLLLYEGGMLWLGPEAMRNGADLWLRNLLQSIGLGEYLFLPMLTCGLLAGWHHVTRRRWQCRTEVLSGMVCESLTLGVCVVVFAVVFSKMGDHGLSATPSTAAVVDGNRVPHLLSFVGAGIYEELLFRLILLSGMIRFCRHCGTDRRSAVTLATIASSLLFAAAHYRLFFGVGVAFSWNSFFFRLGAGTLFASLFLQRGFGIVVGTHAVYDILVVTLR